MSSCFHGRAVIDIADTGNRNLAGTQIIGARHTIEDPGNFYSGMMTLLSGNNRRKSGKSVWFEGGGGGEDWRHRIEKEKQGTVPWRRRSLQERSALSPRYIDYGNCACFCFLKSRKIPRVHVDSTDHEAKPIREAVEYRRRSLTRVS